MKICEGFVIEIKSWVYVQICYGKNMQFHISYFDTFVLITKVSLLIEQKLWDFFFIFTAICKISFIINKYAL